MGEGHRRGACQVFVEPLDPQIVGGAPGQRHLDDLVLGPGVAQAPPEIAHLLDGDPPVLGQEDGLGRLDLLFDLGYRLDLLRSGHASLLSIEKPPAYATEGSYRRTCAGRVMNPLKPGHQRSRAGVELRPR